MASMPGILTDWPWRPLGSFKYIILAPWIWKYNIKSIMKEEEMDVSSFLIFPFLVLRMLHNQLWISLSRYRTAKGNNRIVDKGIEFEQVDRERNWDDQILFNGIIFYVGTMTLNGGTHLAMWRWDGVIISILLHMGPVEFLYYWLHRALHHHFLYSRYHSHHHSSIVTEPITSVTHPFAEHIAYFMLFAIPLLTTLLTGTASIISFAGYITYVDFMNNMGHCNFELIPSWLFSIFPPLKYLMYTPSFHSLHHTQFRTNYSLFMPLYDYIYDTADKSTDTLYENSLERPEEAPDVVHLTHLTTPQSIYHLRLGFAFLASRPYTSYWYLWLMWPVTLWTMLVNWISGNTFVVERLRLDKLRLQTWAIPKYNIQYSFKLQSEAINNLIEEAILEANEKGVKVLSLGLLNQKEELNRYGEVYIERNPKLKTKVVDGSGVAVAVVLNNIPKETTEVLFRGTPSKVARALVFTLCHKGIQVAVTCKDDYDKLDRSIGTRLTNLVLAKTHSVQVWLVGDGLTEHDQKKAPKGTLFIPFSQFPPKRLRKDCYYNTTPAMVAPKSIENIDSCENWLPRRVMSAWRVGGIVHALEEWKEHECGHFISDIDKVWEASLRHGFKPLSFNYTTTQN